MLITRVPIGGRNLRQREADTSSCFGKILRRIYLVMLLFQTGFHACLRGNLIFWMAMKLSKILILLWFPAFSVNTFLYISFYMFKRIYVCVGL